MSPNDHEKKLFILDTNVLMHDPSALFRFQEHDIYIPMIVLEELDHAKKGLSEVSRNARQASRFLDELIQHADLGTISDGIPLTQIEYAARIDERSTGRLFFQVSRMTSVLPESLPGGVADNSILATVLALAKEYPDTQVVLVSKDINMRIKASVLGLRAEDYHSDQVLDDINLLYSGAAELPLDFWATHGNKMESWQDHRGHTFYRVAGPLVREWHINQFLYLPDESNFEAIVRSRENGGAVIELARDFRNPQHNVWGIQARNREQNFAFNVLMDPEIDFVTLLGTAGTGKTLLTLAAGLAQSVDDKVYKEIVMTRETIPVGEDIGFLPGTEEEKMTPWMGALLDNLELLNTQGEGSEWEKQTTQSLLLNRVKVRSLNFMRGRTFLNRYLILDEAQNLTSKQMKTLITRAGPGTKIVCLGNIGQIDTPYLTATTSGLTYVVDRFKNWPHGAHITLRRGERSRLADFAADSL
ncbi:PhoH family protein [Methylococcus sp. EFPC2]|uniref:PhoH family protein n=1 Tax=Methylococcus sp. EFPC2 TaxID=2812648 RepID=UPI0019673A18|nr:PhoH family protein [Methylococcus sp. EFPC2]QSA97020.1 PhoH family protein [Methylococcus sp. EFPC2]